MFVTAPKDMSPSPRQIATGAVVAAGGTAEVPDEVGESLIDQGWSKATKTAAKKAEVQTEATNPSPDGDDTKES